MKRGDIVIVALPGDLGKPRPALILQSDLFSETGSVVLVPITSTVVESMIRLTVQPKPGNGLRELSQIMTDRITTTGRVKVGQVIGRLDQETMQEVSKRLTLFIGLV
ncbi:type II toxin-antitoxin system PemK/MazF family toxin [Devosia sp. 63-57]|uniref:type II toxin-antitoxin system PemK/MazF family toxin n=1 Tax=Devosia sp. 63-57 TaxID=1895751 RepID=UPI00086A45EF|nr:type II toxin-antitoxin system PemK/MazF family toxin [Devosia sp. 63-57]ODT47518.1 MAG: growth inhibitor PemK [Pelagibacterium sp. SCN 63-126]ODU86149.1 MAG: growth inhibitor PemK [Pelagibacterium sp. SCN 63-17]OJX42775.1 MAG: growth inhibitor PemK [Devosia sp. 63-57]